MATAPTVRNATPADVDAVLGILDAAMLATDRAAVAAGVDDGDVLVAAADSRVLGALVLDGTEIRAVAVRPNRRGQGIGTALVAAALDRRDRLVAEFDPGVRPFYEGLRFDIESLDGDRYRGVRER